MIPRRDPFLFPVAMLLAGWGLLIIYRLTPYFAWRQALWLLVSVALMLLITTLPGHLRWLRRYRYSWLTGGLLLLLATIQFGINPSGDGPRLWLGAAGFYFQPSELLKLVLVVFLASYLADHREILRNQNNASNSWFNRSLVRALGPLLLMWGISVVVAVWQRDLGTATIFFIVFLALLYVASGRLVYLLAGLVLLLLAAVAAYLLFDVVQLRVDIWLNPWPEADNRAFQIVQSLMAFSSGGLIGQGLGLGSPGYIPVAHSDFIFAAVGEEFGLIGVLAVMACVAVIVMRGFRVAAFWAITMPFRSLLAAGVTVLLATQSVLIMGGVLKVIPLTGVTLPFMSYGGSSLLLCFAIIGLLLRLSAAQTEGQAVNREAAEGVQ